MTTITIPKLIRPVSVPSRYGVAITLYPMLDPLDDNDDDFDPRWELDAKIGGDE